MNKISKGEKTRNTLIKKANDLFNQEENYLTIEEIAIKLKVTKSRITNHFPKKELLLLAIYEDYESKLAKIRESANHIPDPLSFHYMIGYLGEVMDLMFQYRYAIMYLFTNPVGETELSKHLENTYSQNRERLRNRVSALIQKGILVETVMAPAKFDVFLFKFTTLATTWILNFKLYHKPSSYKRLKYKYIAGIIDSFEPFLTAKGRKEFDKAMAWLEKKY